MKGVFSCIGQSFCSCEGRYMVFGVDVFLNKINKFTMNNHSIATYTSGTPHPTLGSQTKYSHLFPKTQRFISKNPQCPEAFYTYDSQLSHRMTTMGFGKKSDFTKRGSQSPPPTQYPARSIFQEKHKGVTFGCAREKSPDRSYLIPQIHKNPGPGQYDRPRDTFMPASYSIRSKTIDLVERHSNRYTPGPAAYEPVDLSGRQGRHQVSKFGDVKMAKIDPNTKRFPEIKHSPGPSSYSQVDGEMASGKYTLSRHSGKGGRVFSREARFTSSHWKPSNNPGPSNYYISSDFYAAYGKNRLNRTIQH